MFNSKFVAAWLLADGADGVCYGYDGLAMYCGMDSTVRRTLFGVA